MLFLCLGNSLLHIFGNWLFESASWTGKDRNGVSIIAQRSTSSAIDIQDSEIVKMQQRVRLFLLFSLTHSFLSSSSPPSLHSLSLSLSLHSLSFPPSSPQIKSYEAGRAEAISCLCNIFSQMPCGEDVLHLYLSRFYHALSVCLSYDPQVCVSHDSHMNII